MKLRLFGRNYRTPAIAIEHDFVLPAGSTTVSTKLSVPQLCDWTLVGWDTWIDGRRDAQLGLSRSMFNAISNINTGEVSVVTIGSGGGGRSLGRLIRELNNNVADITNLTASKTPTHWAGYSCADLVCVDSAALFAMQSKPDTLLALQRWVRAGGNLWVSNAGERFERLPELEHMLVSRGGSEWSAAQMTKVTRDWTSEYGWVAVPTENKQRDRVESLLLLRSATDWRTQEARDATDPESFVDPAASTISKQDSWPYFLSKSYGTGVITAFSGSPDDSLSSLRFRIQGVLSGAVPPQQTNWVRTEDLAKMVAESLLTDRLYWEERHGNNTDEGNIDFNNWLIPGYGEAPVAEFQLLITLFVIGIGPVNYYLLNRVKKLPMLLVTVPAAAAAATLLLFAYGVLSDGFSVRTRSRSITWLDQHNGESVTWSRHSYYAGLAPGEGLTFDADTVVYPILPYRGRGFLSGGANRADARELTWAENQQRLTRGWLASRTPTQYLTIRANAIDASLEIQSTGTAATVINRLGTDVKLLVVQDKQDRLYMLEGLVSGESGDASLTDRVSVAMRLREAFSENEPQTPPGAIGREVGQQVGSRTYLGRSILETELAAIVAPSARDYGGGAYIAITADAVARDPGVEGSKDSESFHVLRGEWQ
ncbi:MAG: hypothetical protein AAGA92_08450 [Planctomycetota bacterium]